MEKKAFRCDPLTAAEVERMRKIARLRGWRMPKLYRQIMLLGLAHLEREQREYDAVQDG